MPCVAFRGGKAAIGVHHSNIQEFRKRNPFDQRALARQHLKCPFESSRYFIIELIERDRGRHRKSHPLDRTRLQGDERIVSEYRVEYGAACDTARQRSETVERERQGHATVQRDAPLGRLEADDAVISCRDPARAAGVGAERAMRHPVGHRDRSARRRSSGDMPHISLPYTLWRAVMRIDADAGIGEFGHVGAADHDKAGPPQPRHHRRIGFRRG